MSIAKAANGAATPTAEVARPRGWRAVAADLARQDREVWGIGPTFATAVLVLPLVGAVLVASTLVNRPLYRWVTHEDGPIEWAQFAFDLAAALGGAIVAVALHRSHRRWAALLWAIFALSQLFITGEEISWGQRILHTETPAELSRLNHQDETNVHDIRPIQDSINVTFMVVGAYGSVGALAVRHWWVRARPWWFDLFVPPTALFTLFGLVFSYKVLRLTVFPEPRFVIVKFGEYIELCTGVALAAFAWLTVRRLHRQDHQAGGGRQAEGQIAVSRSAQ